jgi:hypothetical protein
MQVDTLQNRMQQAMRGDEPEHEGGGDDGDATMEPEPPTGTTAESID